MVLGLGETHTVFLGVAELVGEDNHQIFAREVLLQFVGQTLEGILVGDGALTCCDDHEHVILYDGGGQTRQLVPVPHRRVFGTDAGVAVVDVFGNEDERLLPTMELDAAVELLGKAAQTFQPTVEARLKLGPRRHGHLDAAQRVERLHEAGEDNLTVQAVVETLDEVAPELRVRLGMDVHTHHNLRAIELAEGVLDTVGNVGGQSHLSLHLHLRGSGLTL